MSAAKTGPGGLSPSWSPEEEKTLRDNWLNGQSITQWLHLLPNRTRSAIHMRAAKLKLGPRGRCERVNPTWMRIKALLEDGKARTAQKIAKDTDAHERHVQELLSRYHGKGLRIAKWPKAKRGRAAAWTFGSEPDSPKPERKSKAEIDRDYAKKRAKDPARLARKAEKESLRRSRRKGIWRTDIAASWITNPIKEHDEHDAVSSAGERNQSQEDAPGRIDTSVQDPWRCVFRLDGNRHGKRATPSRRPQREGVSHRAGV